MTSFYATLRTRSRGALPLLSADSSPLSEGQGGKPPAPPKLSLFRLPSSVTLFCGHSSHKIVPLKRTSFRSPYTPNVAYLQGFCHFLRCPQTHTQGNNLAWCSWCWRGVGSAPQTNFFPQSLHAQRCVFARVLPLFTMSTDPHAGQQSGVVFVVLAWCW